MPGNVMNGYGVAHPAPHREVVRHSVLFTVLLAPPMAWGVQLLVVYGFSSHACFPREQIRETVLPGWDWLWPVLMAVNIVALAIAAAATVASLGIWRRAGGEAPGGHAKLIEAGEGRTRYLAVWGIWSGVWFLLAILFNTISLVGVPLCGS